MLVALLKLLEAAYVCPASPVYLSDPAPHLRAYLGLLPLISGGQLSVAGLSTLAERAGGLLLASALFLLRVHDGDQLQFLRQQQQAVRLLEQPETQQQLSRAVSALSAGRPEGQPPFLLPQLQFAIHDEVCRAALSLIKDISSPVGGGPGVRLQCLTALLQRPDVSEAAGAARSAATALVRLQPDNPRSLEAATYPVPGQGLCLPHVATVQRCLGAVQRCQQSCAQWRRRCGMQRQQSVVASACCRTRGSTPCKVPCPSTKKCCNLAWRKSRRNSPPVRWQLPEPASGRRMTCRHRLPGWGSIRHGWTARMPAPAAASMQWACAPAPAAAQPATAPASARRPTGRSTSASAGPPRRCLACASPCLQAHFAF